MITDIESICPCHKPNLSSVHQVSCESFHHFLRYPAHRQTDRQERCRAWHDACKIQLNNMLLGFDWSTNSVTICANFVQTRRVPSLRVDGVCAFLAEKSTVCVLPEYSNRCLSGVRLKGLNGSSGLKGLSL